MSEFLLLSFIFMAAGVIAVPIASRLGLGSVLGYLLAGIAISPLLSALHIDIISIQHFAEFGVVMMLFLVGLELEPKKLWAMKHKLLGLGGLQVVLTMLVVMVIGVALGLSWQESLAIGCVLALSSPAIVLQTLQEKGLMKSDGGQSSFSVLLFQDIAVIPMLALLPLLATLDPHKAAGAHGDGHGGGDHGATLSLVDGLSPFMTTLVTIGAIAAVVVFGALLTRPLFRFISGAKLRELFTATALMMVVGIALLMTMVGLSPALGTFLAGVVLANSEYRHELESDIAPFKGLLLGLFFITVGAGVNFSLLFANLSTVLGLTFGLIILKALVLLGLSFIFKIQGANRWLFALGLAQAGEFGFVLLSFVVTNNVVPKEIADQLLLVVALSMLLTPLLFIIYDKVIAPRFSQAQSTREADEIDEENDIIIVGVGRIGGLVNRMLRSAGFGATIIDYSSDQLEMLRAFNVKAFFGDATRPDLLHAAGIENAKLLIITLADKHATEAIVKHVVEHHPHVHIIARAVNRDHVYDLYAMGCRDIIRDVYDGSLRMGRSAFEALGIDKEHAQEMRDAFDEMDRRALVEVAPLYNPELPPHKNVPFVTKVNEIMGEWEAELNEKMNKIRNS